MKTEDFIKVLAADEVPVAGAGQRLRAALPLALGLSTALFALGMGLRANLAAAPVMQAVLTKLAVTLTLTLAGLVCAWRAIQPGRGSRRSTALFALPVLVLAGALAFEMQRRGLEQFPQRLFGQNYWRCLVAIPLLALAPFVALLFALRAGAAVAPGAAGVLAGLAAAGLGASLYALHCPDDSPLFILAWYSLASAIMAGLGFLVGRRALAW